MIERCGFYGIATVLFKVLKTWGFIPQSSCSSTFFSTLQRREAGDLLGFDYGENKSRKAFEKNYRPGRKKLIKLQKKKINLWLCQCLRLNTRVTLTHTVILTQLHPCHTHSQAYPYFVKPFLHSMPYPETSHRPPHPGPQPPLTSALKP